MEIFLHAEAWLALLTLTFFEVVLGIDNIIFISIVSNRLPIEIRSRTRNMGLVLAMVVRVLLLLTITWVMKFKEALFTIPDTWVFQEELPISGRDLILIFGGLFLIAKSTREINHEMEGEDDTIEASRGGKANVAGIIVQIILLDIIFSFDSILTAVGLTEHVIIMIIAVVLSIGIMIIFSNAISNFIHRHPSMEVLALGFLILIGFMLFLEGLHKEVPKGYIYFAIVFSMIIEMVNIRVRNRRKKLKKNSMNNDDLLRYPIGKFTAKDSYSTEELQGFIERIENLPREIEKVINSMTIKQLDTPYRQGGWTARQVVHHMADSHTNAYIRFKWAMTESTPTIKAYDEKAWAETPETKLDPVISIELLKALHAKWSALLRRLSPTDFHKEFLHPETKKHMRLDRLTAMYAWHGEHHFGHLKIVANRS